jgi:hypothetical protein
MVECKEMRIAIKGHSRQNKVPEVGGCYFRNTEAEQTTRLTSKPTEPEETKIFDKMLHQCRVLWQLGSLQALSRILTCSSARETFVDLRDATCRNPLLQHL